MAEQLVNPKAGIAPTNLVPRLQPGNVRARKPESHVDRIRVYLEPLVPIQPAFILVYHNNTYCFITRSLGMNGSHPWTPYG